jgi:hypothetical protein
MQLDPVKLRERLDPLFGDNFEQFGELGAAVSVWQDGEPIVDFTDSATPVAKPWMPDALVSFGRRQKESERVFLHVLQNIRSTFTAALQVLARIWPSQQTKHRARAVVVASSRPLRLDRSPMPRLRQ